jgi:hypothetical protein
MAQQKGMKRAQKVADRNRRLVIKKKASNIRRTVRQVEVAEKEAKTAK